MDVFGDMERKHETMGAYEERRRGGWRTRWVEAAGRDQEMVVLEREMADDRID